MQPAETPWSRLRASISAFTGIGADRTLAQTPYHATRRRLVLINLAVVSTILVLMATSIYVVESRALQQQVERQLRTHADADLASAATLLSARATQPPTITLPNGEQDDTNDGERYEPSSPNIFTIVMSASGSIVVDASKVGSFGLPDQAAAAPVLSGAQVDSLVSAHIKNQEYLLYSRAVYDHGKLVGVLQVGQSLTTMEQQTHELVLILLIVGIGALTVTAGASLYLADRALLPMRHAYERQRQFAAAASHELRTPLAFVRSQLELVSRRVQRAQAGASGSYMTPEALSSSVREDLDETLNEVDYMTRLVRDLLLMARDEGDHRSITWRPVDLRRLARDVTDTARPSAQVHGLTLDDHTASDEPVWVMGDYDRLRQLLLILLDNATHYTPTGGRIWLEVRSGRGSLLGGRRPLAQVVVGDTGVGIEPDQQERIFEAFYRSKGHTANNNEHGAGIGLALARWLVSAHDGDISVKSAPGEGSVFTVTLPLRIERGAPDDGAGDDEAAADATPAPDTASAADTSVSSSS